MRCSLLIAGAMLSLAACSAGRAQSAGPDVARSFAVPAFDRIEVGGPFVVEVATGRQHAVAARGPSAMVEKMVVTVENGTLKIHPEKRRGPMSGWGSVNRQGTVRVAVAAPMLRAAAIAGSGDMAIDRIATETFEGSVAGSGVLKLPQVAVRSLGLEIAGSGRITAAGQANEARYGIAGSGDLRAGQLTTERTSVEIAGSGNIDAHARSTAKVDIAGAGNVRVTGGAKCSIDKAGVGNVQCS